MSSTSFDSGDIIIKYYYDYFTQYNQGVFSVERASFRNLYRYLLLRQHLRRNRVSNTFFALEALIGGFFSRVSELVLLPSPHLC